MLTSSRQLTLIFPSVIAQTKALIKMTAFLALAVIFILHHELLTLIIRNDSRRLSLYLKSIQRYCKLVSSLLDIKVVTPVAESPGQGKLMICNHMSYIDVLILFAAHPSLFVTSVEIKETFFLGKLAQLGGCFFVERRKDKRSLQARDSEIACMTARLKAGFNVFLFPEGTSSAGETVLPFKANFFQTAIDGQCSIQPLVLNYLGENSSLIPWYGSMSFTDHLFQICQQPEILVSLQQLPTVEGAHYQDRFQLALDLHTFIREAYEKH